MSATLTTKEQKVSCKPPLSTGVYHTYLDGLLIKKIQ